MQTKTTASNRYPLGNVVGTVVDLGSHLGNRLDAKTLEGIRRSLLGQRQALLWRRREMLASQDLLAEREPDWEDLAATQTTAALLDDLRETERTELASIQAALDRITRGTYGTCVVCHRPIDKKRLRALPDTCHCVLCADARRNARS
jgi:RNA polymerase-binding transcription factor DksA